jgi:hypothetical protein
VTDFDNQLFSKVCELEGRLELVRKDKYESDMLLEEAITIVNNAGLTPDNTDWYIRATKLLESRKHGF